MKPLVIYKPVLGLDKDLEVGDVFIDLETGQMWLVGSKSDGSAYPRKHKLKIDEENTNEST